jgi:hypothetical protein
MSISQHAKRILAAWNVADSESFERELEAALNSCRNTTAANLMEIEQQELLETIVERLRLIHSSQSTNPAEGRKKSASPQGLNAGFALLQHLSHRLAA